jgi:hypothetical protein
MSDEFNGTSIDATKWNFRADGHVPNCATWSNPTESGGYAHLTTTPSVPSYDLEEIAPMPANYYREIRFKPLSGLDNALWSSGIVTANGDHAEIDEAEYALINWFLWSSSWQLISSGTNLASGTNGNLSNPYGNFYDGNFHTFGLQRNNGVYDFWYDNSHIYTLPDPVPPQFTNSLDRLLTLTNPQESLEIFLKEVPEMALNSGSKEFARIGLGMWHSGIDHPEPREHGLGWSDPATYTEMIEVVMGPCQQSDW